MKVLITAEVLRHVTTGVERYTAGLIRGLAGIPDVETALFAERPEHLARFDFPFKAITRRALPSPLRPLSYLTMPAGMFRGYDIIHCPIMVAPFLLSPVLRKPRGTRLVMTCHDLIPLVLPAYQRPSLNLYFRWWMPKIIPLFDAFIANSQWTKHDMVRLLGIPADRIFVTYLASDQPVVARSRVETKGDYFVAVGAQDPRKNLERVVAAFLDAIARTGGRDRLILVGRKGWADDPIKKVPPSEQWRVERTGYLPEKDLQQLYRRAKGLIYPSLYEGFGLPVLEAMAVGCPVITSRTTSLPEVAGDAGLLVDPENTREIAHAIGRLAADADLRRTLIEKGLERADQFSWGRCAGETAQVYRKLLG